MTRPSSRSQAWAEQIRRERENRPAYLNTPQIRALLRWLAGGWHQ